MSDIKKDTLVKVLSLASLILAVSAVIDFALWLTARYMAPCYAVAFLSLSTAMLCVAMAAVLRK